LPFFMKVLMSSFTKEDIEGIITILLKMRVIHTKG
jgi:hypothetical protein